MRLRTYPVCNAFNLKAFVKKRIITDLILVHILIVDLKGMRWQLLCLIQFPIKEWVKERETHEEP